MWWANVEIKPFGGYPQHWDVKTLKLLQEANPDAQTWTPGDGTDSMKPYGTFDGRLWSENNVEETLRTRRLTEFRQCFPQLGSRASEIFERFFSDSRLTHNDILEFAKNPSLMLPFLG